MSQADYTIADQDGASFLVDINSQLAAIVSNNSGATEPSTPYAYQWWADTSSGILKQRNAANSAWIEVGTLASANLGLAKAGANSSITSLTGLTTPLSVAQGGTGANTNAGTAYALKGANGDITSLTALTSQNTAIVTSASGGVGYGTGAGGTVTQATSKSTAVTLNKATGQITMNNAALAAGATVSFGVGNSLMTSKDLVLLGSPGGGSIADYNMWTQSLNGSFSVFVRNISAGSLSNSLVISFAIIKGETA